MEHKLKLDRPLVFFGLNTTGVNVTRDRIIQIAMLKKFPDGTNKKFKTKINPGIPIPPAASKVHGIFDEDVKKSPTFAQLCGRIEKVITGSDLAGYNLLKFGIPFLQEELIHAGNYFDLNSCKVIDAMSIFNIMVPRTLVGALQFYCNEPFEDTHDSMAKVRAIEKVVKAQLLLHAGLPNDIDELHKFCNPDKDLFVDKAQKFKWDYDGDAAFAFGKLNGIKLQEAADGSGRGYMEWMLGKDFPQETKDLLIDALSGIFHKRPQEKPPITAQCILKPKITQSGDVIAMDGNAKQ